MTPPTPTTPLTPGRTAPTRHRGEIASAFGTIAIEVEDGAVVALTIDPGPNDGSPDGGVEPADDPTLTSALDQVAQYLAGRRREFDLPLRLGGTPFQAEVWAALRTIPHGTTITYAELATRVGRPAAHRAVGSANGRNPVAIIVPCHRVVASNGALGGFAYGLDAKRALLDLERGAPSTPARPEPS